MKPMSSEGFGEVAVTSTTLALFSIKLSINKTIKKGRRRWK